MSLPEILQKRAAYSSMRLAEFERRVGSARQVALWQDISVFCAGSYARLEASEYSDIDLFFVYGSSGKPHNPRTVEIKLFASLIDVAESMGFPPFSNDSEYLTTMDCEEILEHLGSPHDDGRNHFTMRMLMLLEAKCIFGQETFLDVQKRLIAAYYRDYPDHQSTFEPWFLMNDIGRFWKTLLLNYENKRNQPTDDEEKKVKQKVKNFKLKYSRMTTCFATVAALASYRDQVTEDYVLELVQLPPHDRLLRVCSNLPDTEAAVQKVLEEYSWFIEQTGQSETDLQKSFRDKNERSRMFTRANAYGDAMFDLLVSIAEASDTGERSRLLRYLVI